MPQEVIQYKAAPTITKFHRSDAFIRGIRGPLGSGKSVACCIEIVRRAHKQKPHNGIRKTRWVIIRNSYRELIDTTLKTWFDWVSEESGTFSKQNMTHTVVTKLNDGTTVHMEVLFRAFDKPGDVKKLLSLEVTGAFINEAREVPKAVLDMLQGRVGRYPSKRDGGPTWFGIILDTNPPDSDHWWPKIFDRERPDNWDSFTQPSGMSKEAENVKNLPPNYYQNMLPGKKPEWIKVYVHGEYGFVSDGKPIYPEFKQHVHVATEPVKILEDEELYIGLDFGLTPAATFAQLSQTGQWRVIDEIVSEDMGAKQFGMILGQRIRSKYRYFMDQKKITITGDPAGTSRVETDKQTPFEVLQAQGIEAEPAHTNDFMLRRDAVGAALTRLDMSGDPGFIVDAKCHVLVKAMAGKYQLKRVQVVGEERFQDKPLKNEYSHVAESLQYLFLGAGADYELIKSGTDFDSKQDYDWDRYAI